MSVSSVQKVSPSYLPPEELETLQYMFTWFDGHIFTEKMTTETLTSIDENIQKIMNCFLKRGGRFQERLDYEAIRWQGQQIVREIKIFIEQKIPSNYWKESECQIRHLFQLLRCVKEYSVYQNRESFLKNVEAMPFFILDLQAMDSIKAPLCSDYFTKRIENAFQRIASIVRMPVESITKIVLQKHLNPLYIDEFFSAAGVSSSDSQPFFPSVENDMRMIQFLLLMIAHSNIDLQSPKKTNICQSFLEEAKNLVLRQDLLRQCEENPAMPGSTLTDVLIRPLPLLSLVLRNERFENVSFWRRKIQQIKSMMIQKALLEQPTAVRYYADETFFSIQIEGSSCSCSAARFVGAGSTKKVWGDIYLGKTDPLQASALMLAKNASSEGMVFEEFRQAARFSHPNLMKVLFRTEAPYFYIKEGASDFLYTTDSGYRAHLYQGNAKALVDLRPQGKEDVLTRICVIRDVARGLSHLHNFNDNGKPLAHMDVKPANMYLVEEKDGFKSVLGDLFPKRQGDFTPAVTFGYLPPEQGASLRLLGRDLVPETFPLSAIESDIWALGLSFFHFLYGERFPEAVPIEDQSAYTLRYSNFLQKIESVMTRADHEFNEENDLIRKMMKVDVATRISASEVAASTSLLCVRKTAK